MERQLPNLYENSGYQFERRERKTLILDVSIPDKDVLTFSKELHEPLRIDKLSDIYLDSFTTFTAVENDAVDNMAFVLGIDQFNINSNSNSGTIFNKIIIPNDASSATETRVHKGKKMNYICSINPETLTTISGTITDLGKTRAFEDDSRFIAEFVIIARD